MKSWLIFSCKNTQFRLHPAVPFFFIYAALTGHLAFTVIATVSILIHECAHAGAALLCGQSFRSIELTPLGAILKTNDTVKQPFWKALFIVVSGPIASWSLCTMALCLMRHLILPHTFCRLVFFSNLSILIMNLLPVYPLDGGRLLALTLEQFLRQRIVNRIMRYAGGVSGASLILLNIYSSWKLGCWNLSLAFAGCCLIYSAYIETTTWALTELRSFLDRKIMLESKQYIAVTTKYVLSTVPISELIQGLRPHRMMLFYCIEPGTMKTLGICTEMELIQQYMKSPSITLGNAQIMSQNYVQTSKYDTN